MPDLTPEQELAVSRLLALPESEIDRSLVDRVIALMSPELDGPHADMAAVGVGRAYEVRWAMTGDDADADAALAAFGHLVDHPFAGVMAQSTIGKILGIRYEQTKNRAVLDEAVRALDSALEKTPEGTPAYAGRTLNLARFLIHGADNHDAPELSDRAVERLRHALDVTPEADSNHATLTVQLGNALLRAYEAGWGGDDGAALDLIERGMSQLPRGPQRAWAVQRVAISGLARAVRLRSLRDLRRALPCLEEVARRDPDPWHKIHLAGALSLRAELDHDTSDLARAEAILATVIEETLYGTAERAGALANHADVLRQLADVSGDPAGLERAAEELREAISWASAANDIAALVRALLNLGIVLTSRARLAGNAEDLSAAVRYFRSAREHGPSPEQEAEIAARMGSALLRLYQNTEEPADLAAAALELEAARAAIPDGTPVPMQLQADLAIARAFGAVADGPAHVAMDQLDGAIALLRELVAAAGVQGPNSQAAAQSLATVLLVRHHVTGDATLLDEANLLLDGRLQRAGASGPSSAAEALALGAQLTQQYQMTGPATALDSAIEVLRDGTGLPSTPEVSAELFSELGIALRHRFSRDGDGADLDAAIEAGQHAVDASPEAGPALAAALANLANALRVRFEHSGNEEDLDAAVASSRRALAILPAGHPHRAGVLTALGNALQVRADRRGTAADATEVVEVRRAAVRECGPDDPRLPRNLMNLGGALAGRFRLTHSPQDLDEAIEVSRQAVEHPAASGAERSTAAANLAILLKDSWEIRSDPADLERWVEAGSRAVDVAPDGHPAQIRALRVLADALTSRFAYGGDTADLDRAIDIRRRVLSAMGSQHPGQAEAATGLASDLVTRSQHGGSLTDLATGLELLQRVARDLPEDHQERSTVLRCLSVALHARYAAAGDPADLEEAVRLAGEAAGTRTASPNDRAAALSNLSLYLVARFQLSGEVTDLERAAAQARASEELAPDDPHARAFAGVNLSIALRELFERRGQITDLDASIAAAQRALDVAVSDTDRAGAWSALGNAWQARYEWDGQLDDLRNAIQAHRQARETGPVSGPHAATHLHNLGNVLGAWYGVTGDTAVLDESITATRAAAAATPAPGQERLSSLTNLGIALRTRYEVLERTDDLQDAIEIQREAVDLAGDDHPGRRSLLANLANSLETRSRVTGDLDDLRAAVTIRRAACAVPPADHPHRCVILLALGRSLRTLADSDGLALAHEASGLFREASAISTAPPQDRVDAARAWGETAHELGDRQQAADSFASAVQLLARVAWHGLDQETRERQLARLSGLAADAAAAAVLADRPEAAIELLEQGRSVLWAQALQLRSDLSVLAETAPELERRLRDVGAGLATGGETGPDGTAAAEGQIRSRRELAGEWDALVEQIRLVPGFETFLQPVPYRELRAAVLGGPLAVVNISHLGCHALVLIPQSAEVSVVTLPDVSFPSVTEQVNQLLTARGRGHHSEDDANRRTADVLSWIWRHIAEPVLDSQAVRAAFAAASEPPRIWWCPTGPAAMLPLHAATASVIPEDGDAAAPDGVMSRAVSSYTPTLAALRRSRAAAGALEERGPAQRHQLAVGMPDTPGAPLPGVDDELAVLHDYFPPPSAGLQLVGKDEAVRARVLDELPRRPWVHWACHARQNETDPRRSAFILGDGPLTVQDLASLSLAEPEFAYLSACETATGSTRLIDEALHLAAATQLLGYPHVVATLWTIGDRSAVRMTRTVYQRLNAGGVPDARDAALALHNAVGELRRLHPDAPLTWAPFIHLGP
jgi:tetratricopeptide (TPR) repeat protein